MSKVFATICVLIYTGIATCIAVPTAKIDPPQSRYFLSFLQTSGSDNADNNISGSAYQEYNSLMKFFSKRKQKINDQEALILLLFDKVPIAFLHKYQQYVSYSEIFTDQTFDCVTATALYSSFLSDLDIDYEIWETNYHTYIKILTEDNVILLETTDPINGYYKGDEAREMERLYISDNQDGFLADSRLDIHKNITPEELVGLLHFNQAVKSYNEGNYLNAMGQIQDAEQNYPSERISVLKGIILDQLVLMTTSSVEN